MRDLSHQEFMKRYKLSKQQFTVLCGKLRHMVGTDLNHKKAIASSGCGVPTEICLSMTLRWLAGGSVFDIIDMHYVGKATFYKYLWMTISAINIVVPLPGLPCSDEERLEKLSNGFRKLNGDTMRGCVGAIDGIAIEIIKPSAWDAVYPVRFRNRKGFFSINCQAICDADLRFLWCSLKTPGGTHDSLAWQTSALFNRLDKNGLPVGYYLVGDDAYGCRIWMVTPYPTKGLTVEKSDFNFYQSRTRITIERAFGVLVARWGVLRRPLTCSIPHTVETVRCCMRLHNMCIDARLPETFPLRRGRERETARDGSDCYRLPRQSDGLATPLSVAQRSHRQRASNTGKRDELRDRLRRLCLKRPATSRYGQGLYYASKKQKEQCRREAADCQ